MIMENIFEKYDKKKGKNEDENIRHQEITDIRRWKIYHWVR